MNLLFGDQNLSGHRTHGRLMSIPYMDMKVSDVAVVSIWQNAFNNTVIIMFVFVKYI